MKISPFLNQPFRIAELDELSIHLTGGKRLSLLRNEDWITLNDQITADSFDNYFYPFLMLAFLKEKNNSLYQEHIGADRSTHPSQYGQSSFWKIFNCMTSYNVNTKNSTIKRTLEEKMGFGGPLCVIAYLYGLQTCGWKSLIDKYRAQLDSLDNITFLSAEDSTDDSDAA